MLPPQFQLQWQPSSTGANVVVPPMVPPKVTPEFFDQTLAQQHATDTDDYVLVSFKYEDLTCSTLVNGNTAILHACEMGI